MRCNYWRMPLIQQYRQVSNISRTLVGNEMVDHSDVVGASPVGAAPTTSSFSTKHLASLDWAKTAALRDEKHLSLAIWCVLYWRFYASLTSLMLGRGWVITPPFNQVDVTTTPCPILDAGFANLCMMTSSNGNIFRVTGHLCGEFTGPGEFPTQRPVTRSFDVFFDLRLNKRLSKQRWGWWFETPSWSLWRQCNG